MITAVSKPHGYVTELGDGSHYFFADTPTADGGSGLYQRPGDILASAYASCYNITVRKLLDARGLAYEEVTTQVEMDRSQPGKLTFRNHTEIQGEIPEEVKEEILREARECPVYRLLQAEKEFLY